MAHWVQRGLEGEKDARDALKGSLKGNSMITFLSTVDTIGGVAGSPGNATEEQAEGVADEPAKDLF